MIMGGDTGDYIGGIRYQIGQCLNGVRESIQNEDALGLANHIGLIAALSAPFIPDDEMPEYTVPDGTNEEIIYRNSLRILAKLLRHLSRKGLYAWEEMQTEDATNIALK